MVHSSLAIKKVGLFVLNADSNCATGQGICISKIASLFFVMRHQTWRVGTKDLGNLTDIQSKYFIWIKWIYVQFIDVNLLFNLKFCLMVGNRGTCVPGMITQE